MVNTLNLLGVLNRVPIPEPYSEGSKIPWDDLEFSKRMLKYHLSQDHDAASRRLNIIDKHVKFIDTITAGPTRMLDLGCGPGFYTSRLTSLGYRCRGIDFGRVRAVPGLYDVRVDAEDPDGGSVSSTELGEFSVA